MVAPHQLRKVEFSRTVRGYSASEVDDYISYLIKNYVELYNANRELESRAANLAAQNEELSRDSRAIRTALLDAQRAAEKIVGDAKEEAGLIISASKRSCDNILNEFRILVNNERSKLTVTQNAVGEFKAKLFAEYQDHIDRIQEITAIADTLPDVYDDEAIEQRLMTDIKTEVAHTMNEKRANEAPAVNAEDAPDPELFDAATKAEKEEFPLPDAEPIAAPAQEEELIPDVPSEDLFATKTFELSDPEELDDLPIPEPEAAEPLAELADELEDELEREDEE